MSQDMNDKSKRVIPNAGTENEIVASIKELIYKGNIRRLVVKNPEGRTLVEAPLTWVAVGVVLFFFFAPFALPIAILVSIVAIAMKLRVEVLREMTDDDDVIEMTLDDD